MPARGRFLLDGPLVPDSPPAAATAAATASGSPPTEPEDGGGDCGGPPGAAAPPALRVAAAAAAAMLLPPPSRPDVEAEDPNIVRTCPWGEPPPRPEACPLLPLPEAPPRRLAAGGVRGPPRVCTPPTRPPVVPFEEAEPADFLPLPLGFFLLLLPPSPPPASVAPAAAEDGGGLVGREEARVGADVEAGGRVFGRLERPHLPPCWIPAAAVGSLTVMLSLSDSFDPISASLAISSGLGVSFAHGKLRSS